MGSSSQGIGRYEVLDRIVITPHSRAVATGKRAEVQLCISSDGIHVIRPVNYIRRGNTDGTVWWTISPWPLCCSIEEAELVADAIKELVRKYRSIERSFIKGRK